jgi:uncharacterized protein (DUF2141 family)
MIIIQHMIPMMFRHSVLLLGSAVLLLSCATQRPPEGGPADSEAPEILSTDPPTGTVNFTGDEVHIEFSERVDRRSFEDAVHISPLPSSPPVYDWSAREVRIRFSEVLAPERTYVITVGSTVKDVRAGNRMRGSVQVAFSTGGTIDGGTISGAVLDEKAAGVSVFAYRLSEGRADTLDPAQERPDYAIRTGEDGSFSFSYLADGLYRLFAVRDQQNNMLYDVENDDIGIPAFDVSTGDSLLRSSLRFRLIREDTTRPWLQRVEALSIRRLRLSFSEDVQPFPPAAGMLRLSDSARGEELPVLTILPASQGKFAWDVYLAAAMDSVRYGIVLDSLRDVAGNTMGRVHEFFDGSLEEDTARPIVREHFPARDARGVDPDSSFSLRFDRPVVRELGITLSDSSGRDIPVVTQWPDMTRVDIGHAVLQGEARYRLCVNTASVRDAITGRTLADSLYCVTFTTAKSSPVGAVSGAVIVGDSVRIPATVHLRGTQKGAGGRTLVTDSTGSFKFSRVPEGSYVLDVYLDLDGDGRYSPGSRRPLRAPEPFITTRDTIRVRARWDTDRVLLRLAAPASSR